jgi:hypothetical protein
MGKTQIIFNVALAKILIRKDFKIVDITRNHTCPERSVYYFEDKEGLTDIIANFATTQRLKRQEQHSLKAI